MEKKRKRLRHPEKVCALQLLVVAEKVTAQDRRNAMSHLSISYVTVGRYLQGKVANLDTGLKLLNYFDNAIDNRHAELIRLAHRGKRKEE